MSKAREFTAYVVLRSPEDHQPVTFEPGDEVPEWALDATGDHVTQGVTRSVKTAEEAPASDVAPDAEEDATEIVTPEYEQADEDVDDDELPPYDEWSKTDLRAEVEGRELDVAKKATVAELVEALQADDAAHAETE